MVATPRAPRAAADVARDIRAEMTSTSSSVDALRAHLASALASARDASARVSSDASSDEAVRDASSVRDPRALVARFRAVNDARETLARVARAEAALRDASAGARSVHPSSATRADLPRLREASASLLGASDALRDARDATSRGDPPGAPAHDRFTASLAARIRAECDRLRAVATRLAVDAAGRTWPRCCSAPMGWVAAPGVCVGGHEAVLYGQAGNGSEAARELEPVLRPEARWSSSRVPELDTDADRNGHALVVDDLLLFHMQETLNPKLGGTERKSHETRSAPQPDAVSCSRRVSGWCSPASPTSASRVS